MKSLEEIEKEEFSVAIPASINDMLLKHLLRSDKQEDAVFALYKPSHGVVRLTGIIYKIIFPEENDRFVHGNVSISPQYFKRVCHIASMEKSGIVLLHSHLSPGWQNMSSDDINTEKQYSASALTLTDLPLIGLTLGTDGTWSARIWEHKNNTYKRKWAATVRVVGEKLSVSYYNKLRPQPKFKNIYKRTVTVWGEKNHAHLARLRVGIIGLGSVGSMVSESLARMGVERFVLIDFDEVQEHNLDRLLGATKKDVGVKKVSIVKRQILKNATSDNPLVTSVSYGVTEENGYRNALDCDLIFSCVDRPWPREVLNHIAYNHLIPVIDGGIRVMLNSKTGEFEGANWQAQSVGPERPCLECLKVYSNADAATEKAGMLDDPTYLNGLPQDHQFKRNENIFPFSMNLASLEVMQFIEQVTGIGFIHSYGVQRYSYNHGYIRIDKSHSCRQNCIFHNGIALADSVFPQPIGFDHSAQQARHRQNQ